MQSQLTRLQLVVAEFAEIEAVLQTMIVLYTMNRLVRIRLGSMRSESSPSPPRVLLKSSVTAIVRSFCADRKRGFLSPLPGRPLHARRQGPSVLITCKLSANS